jgi:small subunit ribosomal protein S14
VAKKSKIAKNRQRAETVARYAERRAALKAAVVDPALSQ